MVLSISLSNILFINFIKKLKIKNKQLVINCIQMLQKNYKY